MIGVFVAPSALPCHIGIVFPDAPGAASPNKPAKRMAAGPRHIGLSREALFVLAATVSVVYLVLESRLKSKRPLSTGSAGAPSLERLDRLNYRLLGWGFFLSESRDSERRNLG